MVTTRLSGIRVKETDKNYIDLDEYILYLIDCEDQARDSASSFNIVAAEVYRDLRKALQKYRSRL